MERATCAGTKKDGTPCQGWATHDSPYCMAHGKRRAGPEVEMEEAMSEETGAEARLIDEQLSGDLNPKRQKAMAEVLEQAAKRGLFDPAAIEAGQATAPEGFDEEDEYVDGHRRGQVQAPKGGHTMEGQATRAAIELLAQERAANLRRQKERERARKTGRKLPPLVSLLKTPVEAVDPIRIVDSMGRPTARPGWYQRWVRLKDDQGEPTTMYVEKFRQWGGQAIIDPHTNKPIIKSYGLAMEMPLEYYGARVIKNSPHAAFDDDAAMAHLDDYAEAINSRAGRRGGVVSVSSAPGDGDRSA